MEIVLGDTIEARESGEQGVVVGFYRRDLVTLLIRFADRTVALLEGDVRVTGSAIAR